MTEQDAWRELLRAARDADAAHRDASQQRQQLQRRYAGDPVLRLFLPGFLDDLGVTVDQRGRAVALLTDRCRSCSTPALHVVSTAGSSWPLVLYAKQHTAGDELADAERAHGPLPGVDYRATIRLTGGRRHRPVLRLLVGDRAPSPGPDVSCPRCEHRHAYDPADIQRRIL